MNKRQIKTIKDDTSSNVVFWHNMKIKNVFKKLQTNEKGLSENEVVLRLEKYGSNKISIVKRFKMLKMLYEQFTDFLVLLLIAAGLISLGLGIANSTPDHLGEEIYDAIAIFTIVLINATIGFIQHFKSDQALKKLKEYFEQNVLVVRNGKEGIIHSSELIPGDIIILEVGDKIPADSRLVEANSFKVDEAALTGESNPITKSLQLVPEESRIHARKNMIYSGCTCVYGRGKAVVVATGLQTEMGKIAELTQVKQEQTPLQKALGKFGKVLGIIILAVCAVVMIVEVLVHIGDIQAGEITLLASLIDGFETAIALAISAVPEGLPAAIVITLAIGVSRMAKRKTIVSRLPAVETLGSVDYICSDKTGTLTRNEMTVKQIWTMEGSTLIEGSGYIVEGDFKQNNQKIKPKENPIIQKLLETAYHCNNAGVMRENGKITIKGDPTEAALVVVAEKAGFTKKSLLKREHEIFFDSDRKRMTTIHDDNGKKYAFMKGSPPVVLTRSNTIKKNNNKITITKQIQNKIEKANLEMSEKALRVLALAYKEVNDNYDKKNEDDIEDNMIFLGLVGMIDPPRTEVKQAIKECKEAGITTVMITGDQEATAVAVAKEIGIIENLTEGLVVNGENFSILTDEELLTKVEEFKVYSRMSPKDKFRVVEVLQSKGHVVAVTGDGVNDAPALKKADIGIAMGITGTDVSKEVADMVITDDAFNTIVSAVEEGRNIFANMKKFIRYMLSCNFDEILTVLLISSIFGILPLLPLQILFLNLVTDALPALSLSFDPYDPELMKRPPRGKQSSFIKDIYIFALLAGIVAFFATSGIFLMGYMNGWMQGPIIDTIHTWAMNDGLTFSADPTSAYQVFMKKNIVAYAQVLAFVTTLSFELWFIFIARNDNDTSLFKSNPFKNKHMIGAILISWVLLITTLYVKPLGVIFSSFSEGYFYFLTGRDWMMILAFTIGLCLFIEFIRTLLRSDKVRKIFAKNTISIE